MSNFVIDLARELLVPAMDSLRHASFSFSFILSVLPSADHSRPRLVLVFKEASMRRRKPSVLVADLFKIEGMRLKLFVGSLGSHDKQHTKFRDDRTTFSFRDF